MVQFMPSNALQVALQLARNKQNAINSKERSMEQLREGISKFGEGIQAMRERAQRQKAIDEVRRAMSPDHDTEGMYLETPEGLQALRQRLAREEDARNRRADIAMKYADIDSRRDRDEFLEGGRTARNAASIASREKLAGEARADRMIRDAAGGFKDLIETGVKTIGNVFAPKNRPHYISEEERARESYRKSYTTAAKKVDEAMQKEATDMFKELNAGFFDDQGGWDAVRRARINTELRNMGQPPIPDGEALPPEGEPVDDLDSEWEARMGR